jgi:hypothetical protein
VNGFIYLLWDTGSITRETIACADRMAENKFLARRIVRAAWCLTDFAS